MHKYIYIYTHIIYHIYIYILLKKKHHIHPTQCVVVTFGPNIVLASSIGMPGSVFGFVPGIEKRPYLGVLIKDHTWEFCLGSLSSQNVSFFHCLEQYRMGKNMGHGYRTSKNLWIPYIHICNVYMK